MAEGGGCRLGARAAARADADVAVGVHALVLPAALGQEGLHRRVRPQLWMGRSRARQGRVRAKSTNAAVDSHPCVANQTHNYDKKRTLGSASTAARYVSMVPACFRVTAASTQLLPPLRKARRRDPLGARASMALV